MRKGAAAIFGAVVVGCRKGNGLPMVNMEPQQLPPLSWQQKAKGDFCRALLNIQDSLSLTGISGPKSGEDGFSLTTLSLVPATP